MELRFWKYEGAGNDFVMIDGRDGRVELTGERVRALCDRHRGVGADGVIVLTLAEGHDFGMRYYNADGGEVDMCGNGGRCIALLADHLGIGGRRKRFFGRDGAHDATVDAETVALGMRSVESVVRDGDAFVLNTGVPHYVEFVDDVKAVDVVDRGRRIRYDARFAPEGINVNFVERAGAGELRVRTYERGVEDETLACGTGATAAAIAAYVLDGGGNKYRVEVPGGELAVSFTSDGGVFRNVTLTGPARRVFEGRISL